MRISSEPYQFMALVRRAITPFLRLVPLVSALLMSALVLGCSGALPEAAPSPDEAAATVTQIHRVRSRQGSCTA